MDKVCILTDSSAQFPAPSFPGIELVNVIPLHVQILDHRFMEGKGLKSHELPTTPNDGDNPKVSPPTVDEFRRAFNQLGKLYKEIVVITLSHDLNPAIKNASKASKGVQGFNTVRLIDSQSTAVGLGLLVQAAAKAAVEGADGDAIQQLMRDIIPKVYSLFSVEGLTYMHHSGYLGKAQAIIGEKEGIMPLIVFDNGKLMATQKIRNYRNMVDILHEYICEFTDLLHIGIVQGVPPFEQETRALRERINSTFPAIPISEHIIGTALATIIGPRSLGLFIMEK